MFKPRPGARAAKTVGHYALQIDFTDGHTTGIFSYDYLRTICPCAQCAYRFAGSLVGRADHCSYRYARPLDCSD